MDLGRAKEEVRACRYCRLPLTAVPFAQEKLNVCRKYFIGGFFLLPWMWLAGDVLVFVRLFFSFRLLIEKGGKRVGTPGL